MPSLFHDLTVIEQDLQRVESDHNFAGDYDYANAFLEIKINSDSDSEAWGNQLLQMYINWAEFHQLEHDVINSFRIIKHERYIDEAIQTRTAVIKLSGQFTYALLKNEIGTHYLLPTHVKATINVYPEVITDSQEINLNDMIINVVPHTLKYQPRMTGFTTTHIKVSHRPTGINAQANGDRSQHRNKNNALEILMAKLYHHAERTKPMQLIRRYDPEKNIVKDLTTAIECNFLDTLNGNIDGFIEAHLNLAL